MTEKAILWSQSMSVGIDELDAAHLNLINLVNNLFEAGLKPGAQQNLEAAVATLMTHTLAHFAHEEAYLNSRNAAVAAKHQSEHIRLFAELEAICQRLLKEGGKEFDSATAAFLRHWMVSHIMGHDKRDYPKLAKAS
ncbi:putative Hemerythrin-like metal-binding protein [Rhodospirillaceae bacterium LM-1]|nr:putative Hemerythrin-like metal-binding protein [Rhodospirillaceae bacterium LM-1]